MQVNPGCEFMGAVSLVLPKHRTEIRLCHVDTHQDQGIVKHFNYLARDKAPRGPEVDRIGGTAASHHYNPEQKSPMRLVESPLTPSRLSWRKPSVVASLPVDLEELPLSVSICYLYQPGELESDH